ncbi:hypothetical protein [Pseudomonas fluorescens]|uniref:hypothetical protein n=1 Tax=Pseudomonas fluorescens TaxID=294 RepID=UPI000CA30612|nr:hypothetical protein [Pseudomonas fluorescens]AUM71281.1 hypothetical protein C0J56_22165 [Pseudomonas fluorescens]
MNTMSEEERLKVVKSAAKLEAQGSITITLNEHTTKTEDVFILDAPDNALGGFIGDEKGLVMVQFSSLTEPGTYDVKGNGIWIYMSFHGFVGGQKLEV